MSYYVIKIFNDRMRQRGYLVFDDSIRVSTTKKDIPGFQRVRTHNDVRVVNADLAVHVTKFETPDDAQKAIRTKKLRGGGIRFLIISASDFMKDPDYPKSDLDQAWYIERTADKAKLCYDTKQGLYFQVTDAHFCSWPDHDQGKAFFDQLEFDFEIEMKPLI